MAVGVMYAGLLAGNTKITAASALALSLGIAIQNFPEGAIISLPLRAEGEVRGRHFLEVCFQVWLNQLEQYLQSLLRS